MGRKDLHIAELTATNAKYKRALDDSEKATKKSAEKIKSEWGGIENSIKKAAKGMLAFVGAWTVKDFIKDSIDLAGKAEGIREAFERLNQPNLLDDLRRATRGTVTDLQLMQTAVQAKNFRIPLSELATLLEFAQKRATQTGEAVDYLVDSIVTGIGRKSVMIMDNLGISSVELQEEVKKVGDFGLATGNIVKRELEQMGEVSITTKDRIAQINTVFENMKLKIGEVIAPHLNRLIDRFEDLVNMVETIPAWVKELATTMVTLPQKLGAGSTVLRQMPAILEEITAELESGKRLNEEDEKAVKNIYDSYVKAQSSLEGIIRKKLGINQWNDEELAFLKAAAVYYEKIANTKPPPKTSSNTTSGGDGVTPPSGGAGAAQEEAKQREEILLSSEENLFEARQQMYQQYIDDYLLAEQEALKEIEEAKLAKMHELKEAEFEEVQRLKEAQLNAYSELENALLNTGNQLVYSFGIAGHTLVGRLVESLNLMSNILGIVRSITAMIEAMETISTLGTLLKLATLPAGGLGSIAWGLLGVGGRASGGPVNMGTPYMVGEKGPELFIPQTSGTIVNNTNTKNFMRSDNRGLEQRLDALNRNISLALYSRPPNIIKIGNRVIAEETTSVVNTITREGRNKNEL